MTFESWRGWAHCSKKSQLARTRRTESVHLSRNSVSPRSTCSKRHHCKCDLKNVYLEDKSIEKGARVRAR